MPTEPSRRDVLRSLLKERLKERLQTWAEWLGEATNSYTPAALAAVTLDEQASDYARMAAGLKLALVGDTAGIPVLRRVLNPDGFALTASCMEQGDAALGLALLGDVESMPAIDGIVDVNGNGSCRELALEFLAAHRDA